MDVSGGRAGDGVVAGGLAVVAWVAGVALLDVWPRLPMPWVLQGLCALAVATAAVRVVMALASVRGRGIFRQEAPTGHCSPQGWRRWTGTVAVLFAAALLGHGSTGLRTQLRLDARLPHALEGVPLVLVGVIDELPRRSAQGVQFTFRVESARTLAGSAVAGVPARVWLGWWMEGHVDLLMAATVPEPRPGERWALPVTLKRPHGTQNPGAFDAERWFLDQNLGASGSVSAAHRGAVQRLGTVAAARASPEAWRAALRERIDAHVQQPALAGLVAGLTIGDQSAVDAADWQLFRAAGVAHALSISGAHITVFAAMAAPVAAWLWKRWPRGCLIWPASWVGIWVGWALALAYALLAGWGLPAQRTVAMLAVVALARTGGLNWPAMGVWLAAASPIVVWDPWAVSQAGFWLSFAAVGLLLLAGVASPPPGSSQHHPSAGRSLWRPQAWLQTAWKACRAQVVTAVGLAPLAAVCFGELSVVGVVGNLVALPWITLVLTPMCLLGLLWPPIWTLLPAIVDPLRALMGWLVSIPGAVVTVPATGMGVLGMALMGACLALMRLPAGLRASGLVLMVPLLLPPPRLPAHGEVQVWAMDVGQGTAVLVRTRAHALLLDAGPAWGEGRDAGDRVVLPVLRHLGVRRLDELVITHRDLDHAGGAASVLRGMPVSRLRSSLEPQHPLRRFPVPHEACRRGQSWQWDGVQLQVLHPFGDEAPGAKPNTLSCVLRIEDRWGRSLLLTGDIEREQEEALVRIDAQGLRSDGLVVPHHGSRTSSTESFLRATAPRWAVAQAGYRNRYGHPATAVVQRYGSLNIPLLSSPWCGALRWDGAEPECWRQIRQRHWHDQPEKGSTRALSGR